MVPRTISRSFVNDIKVNYKPRRKKSKSLPHQKRQVIRKVIANNQHSIITPEHASSTLGITIEKTKHLLRVTTQKGSKDSRSPNPTHLHNESHQPWQEPDKREVIC